MNETISMQASELPKLRELLDRAGRRIRFRRALESITTGLIASVILLLPLLWLWRMQILNSTQGSILGVLACMLPLVWGLVSYFQPIKPQYVLATLDRSGDRSSSLLNAWEFHSQDPAGLPKETRALMEASIRAGEKSSIYANPKKSFPWKQPRDTKPAIAFLTVGLCIFTLALELSPKLHPYLLALASAELTKKIIPVADELDGIHPDDLEYTEALLQDLKELAEQNDDPELKDFIKEVEEILRKAEDGSISKEELLSQLEKLEDKYNSGSASELEELAEELKKTGKELQKDPMTKELGKALAKGDLDKAQEEMQKLAEKLKKGEIPHKKREALAKSLEKANKAFEKRMEKKNETLSKQLAQKREEMRRLKKEISQKPNDTHLKRRLKKKERELKKLERKEAQAKKSPNRRRLSRLHRNMQKSAESLRNKSSQSSSERVREMERETREMQRQMQRGQNQKKSRSKLADLRDALRRARPKPKGQGGKKQGKRAQRMREWEKRAQGKSGNPRMWRKGQGGKEGMNQGQKGQGKQGQNGQGPPGDQPGGNQVGDQSDPNLQGDPTARMGKTEDQQLDGAHGAGPSRKQTILSSAQKGFSGTAYKKVFTEYKRVIEEVMTQEKVPQGYKYYIKQYFQRIRPQE